MRLICMSFDGDYVTEGEGFETEAAAWERADDMGSRWYFYPFHFVTTESGLTVVDAPGPWTEELIGRRVKTVQRWMRAHGERYYLQKAGVEKFWLTLPEEWKG